LKWLTVGVAAGAVVVLERLWPLRRAKEPGPRRVGRNVAIGLLAAAATRAMETPIVGPAQQLAERNGLGLLRRLPMPRALRVVLGFLLLDYTLYLWHWLNHRSPALWRFHAVHHCDLDMDSSTGIRFHVGELVLGAVFRAAQVLLLGVDRATLLAWTRMQFASVIFHHSNLQLPLGVEQQAVSFIVTPRMHGIHHSARAVEANSNYASLLSVWDRLHHSLRLQVRQADVVIGVAGLQRPADVTLERMLTLPFRREAPLLPLASGQP
jgi:sterol desaturase/sphingolipid hydroxylase (fatty acid hydroxylase superfamily)